MAIVSQQLAEDFGQLKDLLELYPKISILKTEGQPPDNYEIVYNLRGYIKDGANSITIGESHRIRLSLPFGYPHFAPIAKPLTPVFHPDFDPTAIHIAARWQQKPSLAELVLHIGEMIGGNIYSLEDPFNQEAADWYKIHKHQLPLDSLNIANIEESTTEQDSHVDDIFASLNLESDHFLDPEQQVGTSEIEDIRDLITQNKFFTANKRLADIPDNANFPDREDLQQTIGKVFRKTDQLFKLAEKLENMGKFNEAKEVLDNLLSISVDAPGVDTLRTRIHQSFLIAQTVDHPQKKGTDGLESTPDHTTKTTQYLAKLKAKPAFLENPLPYKPLLAIIFILGGCIGAISLYFSDQSVLSQSQANLHRSQLLIEKKQFDSALATLEAAKIALNDLTILRFRKNSLVQEINNLVASTELQEGLKGRILYQGEYIPTERAVSLKELIVLTDQAQILDKQNKLAEALTLYRQALKFASEHNLSKQQFVIQENIAALELRSTLSLAEKAEKGNKWNEAADAYRKALKISGNMDDLGTTDDITHRLTAATFRNEMDQSKKAFTQSQWKETIKLLEHAQQAIDANPAIATEKERGDLHRLLINSQLYLLLSSAKEAYRQKNWDLAIKEYQNALTLLESASDSTENTLGESISKIEKTLLMVKVAQIQDKIFIAEGGTDLVAILTYNKEIQQLIQTSKYVNDPIVKTMLQKVNDKIDKYQEQVTLKERIAWLEEHFEEIFRANYPTSQGSKLLQPKAIFLKKIDNKPVFTVNCLERSQGSSFKLELNYVFDIGTGKWSVYKER